jgi:hypothetical protein
MSSATENQAQRTRTAAPPAPAVRQKQREALSGRDVMDTLLGQNDLSAYDVSGTDPYNATGKFFRR